MVDGKLKIAVNASVKLIKRKIFSELALTRSHWTVPIVKKKTVQQLAEVKHTSQIAPPSVIETEAGVTGSTVLVQNAIPAQGL